MGILALRASSVADISPCVGGSEKMGWHYQPGLWEIRHGTPIKDP